MLGNDTVKYTLKVARLAKVKEVRGSNDHIPPSRVSLELLGPIRYANELLNIQNRHSAARSSLSLRLILKRKKKMDDDRHFLCALASVAGRC